MAFILLINSKLKESLKKINILRATEVYKFETDVKIISKGVGLKSLLISVLIILISCSKNSPNVTKKEQKVVENPNNVTETMALKTLSASDKSTDEALEMIIAKHKIDFNYRLFWNKVRYPKINIYEFSINNLNNFYRLANTSCDADNSSAYFQFINYLESNLDMNKAEIKDTITLNFLSHLNLCGLQISEKQVFDLYQKLIDLDSELANSNFELFLSATNTLLSLNSPRIITYFSEKFSENILVGYTNKLVAEKKFDGVVNLIDIARKVHPFRADIYTAPVKYLINDEQAIIKLAKVVEYKQFMKLFSVIADNLENIQNNKIPTILENISKLRNNFYTGIKVKNTDLVESLLDDLKLELNAYHKYGLIQKDKEYLAKIEELANEFVSHFPEDTLSISYLSKRSIIAFTAFSMTLKRVDFAELELPDAIEEENFPLAFDFMKLRQRKYFGFGVESISKAINKICKKIGVRQLTYIDEIDSSSGCFKTEAYRFQVIDENVAKISVFAIVQTNGGDINIKDGVKVNGFLDTSNDDQYPPMAELKTPEDFDALGLTFVFGIHVKEIPSSENSKLRSNTLYVFPYHYIIHEALDGQNLNWYPVPKKGKEGGSIVVPWDQYYTLHHASYGSPGQMSPKPASGGKSYKMKIEKAVLNRWVRSTGFYSQDKDGNTTPVKARLLNLDSIDEKEIHTLLKYAKKSITGEVLLNLNLEYPSAFTDQNLKVFHENIDRIKEKFNMKKFNDNEVIEYFSEEVNRNHFYVIHMNDIVEKLILNGQYSFESKKSRPAPRMSNGDYGKDGSLLNDKIIEMMNEVDDK